MNNIYEEIIKLENEIDKLPKGTLIYKNINGKLQPYLQQTINKKTKSTYIKIDGRDKVISDINKRNELIKQLRELKNQVNNNIINNNNINEKGNPNFYNYLSFNSSILLGEELKNYVLKVRDYKTRNCYSNLIDYLYNDVYNKVFILYGIRRTGKTTLIKQAILNMKESDFLKSAFIHIKEGNTLAGLNKDLIILRNNGYKYIFIDEVTRLTDFIEGSSIFPDVYVSGGMKIVLSGRDSLGFWFSEDDELFDRAIFAHTTFISYQEFEEVLGIKGIDNYLCYGGTMCLDGLHYNDDNLYSDKNKVDEYVDSAIAYNIQHSLKGYQYGGHFRHLEELYEAHELTNVINRVVEDTNHRFTMEVLTNDFISHDLGVSANNLRSDKNNSITVLDNIDLKEFTNNLKTALEILNKNEQKKEIKEIHRLEIEEYLTALDLINHIDVEYIPTNNQNKKITVISQPGLRYSQAKLLIENLLKDPLFESLSSFNKKYICERILNEIKGRMMEELVLLETVLSRPKRKVFKLCFNRGEFDMVVFDQNNLTCDIYEIKHSEKILEEQYKNLVDEDKINKTIFKYGNINHRYVIYRGISKVLDNGIIYLNVEEYLKGLRK